MMLCLETSAFHSRLTGIGHYAWFLAERLARLSRLSGDIELLGFDGVRFHEIDLDYLADVRTRNDAEPRERPTISRRRLAGFVRRIPFARTLYRQLKEHRFRRRTRRIDLFHAVNYLPPASFRRAVPLIHDISHERHPETHPAERVAWLRQGMLAIGNFPILNTVSEFSAGEISEFYGIDRSRIRVTYPGVSPAFTPDADGGDAALLAELGLSRNAFFIVVGTLEPRKNLRTILDGFRRLPRDVRIGHPLVISGPAGWGKSGLSETGSLVEEGSLRVVGYQSERDLAALYRNSRTLLFGAIYEGFGIPTIEALASGKRPILSDIAVMREVAGNSGDYVAALDPEAWAASLLASVHDSRAEDGSFRSASRERSRRFCWDANAAGTLACYRDAEAMFDR
jgi:alpha-1,3-rhamnosyl/mannosyltransferase